MLFLMVATPLFSPWVSSDKEHSLTFPSTSDMLGGLVVPLPFGQFLSRMGQPENGESTSRIRHICVQAEAEERVPAIPGTRLDASSLCSDHWSLSFPICKRGNEGACFRFL